MLQRALEERGELKRGERALLAAATGGRALRGTRCARASPAGPSSTPASAATGRPAASAPPGQRPRQRAGRFSPKARTPSREVRARRRRRGAAPGAPPRCPAPGHRERGAARGARASCPAPRGARWRPARPPWPATPPRASLADDDLGRSRPQPSAVRASTWRPSRNSSRVRASPTASRKRCEPRVRVDQPELGRRHAQADAVGRDAQVAAQRQLESAADRVAGQRGHGRQVGRVEGLERARERVGHEALGLLGEDVVAEVADVVARENIPSAPVSTSARTSPRSRLPVRAAHGRGDPVEDRVVERVALARVGDRQPQDAVQRPVEEQLARHGAADPSAGRRG